MDLNNYDHNISNADLEVLILLHSSSCMIASRLLDWNTYYAFYLNLRMGTAFTP